MQPWRLRRVVLGVALMAPAPTQAALHFVLLGQDPPPREVGGLETTPFDVDAQAKIPDFTLVTEIPGSPVPGELISTGQVMKLTTPTSWPSWSHGYAGPVFYAGFEPPDGVVDSSAGVPNGRRLLLPPAVRAVYLYAQPTGCVNMRVSANYVVLCGEGDATGFAFFSDAPDEFIDTLVVTSGDELFAMAEFGVAGPPIPVELQSFTIEN